MSEEEKNPEKAVQAGRIKDNGEIEPDDGLPEFVTRLTPIEQQVGINIIAALQHPETVAVLSTVAMGPDGSQNIMSIGLDPELLGQVRELLQKTKNQEPPRIPCIGFHCSIDVDDEESKG